MTNGFSSTGEGLAEGLDRPAGGVGGPGDVARKGNVLLERQMDDAVGRGGGVAQGRCRSEVLCMRSA